LKLLVLILALMQVGPRAPLALSESGIAQRDARRVEGLTPAETLLDPETLRAIERASAEGPSVRVIQGSDSNAGEIAVVCGENCEPAEWALKKIGPAVAARQIAQPARTIRIVTVEAPRPNTKAAIFIAAASGRTLQIVRGLWSTSSITDEVAEVFARQAVGAVDARSFESAGQPRWDRAGIPMTTIVPPADATGLDRSSFVAAASAYFLATLPNAGAEALLSHLTVGAHARLAEDGRKAVAQMGTQQRAGADVLIMFAQAIEREQRRMRSFERFMPTPVDPMLHSRILDMEKGITSVWASIGITSSPFVPAAERIRGRGGEDRRIVTRVGAGPLPTPEPPAALLRFPNVDVVIYELGNFIDGKRSISDIRDAVSAEFGPVALPVVVDYFERLAKQNAITIK
jgi:hypothetical protein